MKVLLLHLPDARTSYILSFSRSEPLAPLYLAPALRPEHELRFVDLRITPKLSSELQGFRPEVAAVGVNPLSYRAADRTLAELRAAFPGIKILLFADFEYGSNHVTERPLDFAHPLADALVEPCFLAPMRKAVRGALDAWGQGSPLEEVPGLWLRDASGPRSATPKVPNEIGNPGVPDRTLLGKARGRYRFAGISRMAYTFYTFGCKFKCRFCPMSKHDGSYYVRRLDDLIEELQEITEPHVFLQDYEPFLAPEAMEDLADAVEKARIRKRWYMLTRSDTAIAQQKLLARWQRLGLRWLYLGLDAHSPERLREIRKANTIENNERALRLVEGMGLGVTVGFPVSPDFSREDFAALRACVKKLRPPLFDFTVETPLVGTTLFDETESKLTTRDWSLYDLGHAVLPTRLPLHEFYREMTRLHTLAMRGSLGGFLRHYPLRDFWDNGLAALRALPAARRSARDHAA